MKRLLFISLFVALIAAGCSENPGEELENGGLGSGDNTEQDGDIEQEGDDEGDSGNTEQGDDKEQDGDDEGGSGNTEQGGDNEQEGDDEGDSDKVVDLAEYIVGHWRCTRLEWRFAESEDGGVFHSEDAPFEIVVSTAEGDLSGNVKEEEITIGYEERHMEFKADGTLRSEVRVEYLPEYFDSEEREKYDEPEDEDMTYTLSGNRIVMYDSEGYSLDFEVEMTKDEDGGDCMVLRHTSDSPTEAQPWTMQNMYFTRLKPAAALPDHEE